MNKLPKEIIYKIISFTYSPQPKYLTEDIISFYLSKQICNFLYHDYWIIQMGNETLEDKYWLLNNLFNYTNKFLHSIFTRIPLLNTQNKVINYMKCFNKTDIKTQINILFGLMTPIERNIFLNTR
jgi:hypothetical protein